MGPRVWPLRTPTFGPYYPPRLQRVVDHAERLAQFLTVDRVASAVGDEWATAWLVGRSSEIEQVVRLVLERWWNGDGGETAAIVAIESYLGDLHNGMARHMQLSAAPCCDESLAAMARRLAADAGMRDLVLRAAVPANDGAAARDTDRDLP